MDTVVSPKDFFDRKIDQYIMLWKYGKHTTKEFKGNMIRMGYDEEVIQKSIDNYFSTEDD